MDQALKAAARTALPVAAAYLGSCSLLVAGFALGREDSGTVLSWLEGGVLLAALGLRGTVLQDVGTGDDLLGGSGSVGVTAMLLSLTALALALSSFAGRRAERRAPSGQSRGAGAGHALLEALFAAGALALLALLTRVDLGEAQLGSGEQHAGAGALLLNGTLVLGAGFLVGRLREQQGFRLGAWLHARSRGYSGWVVSALQHAVLSGALLTLAGLGYLLLSDAHEVARVDATTGSTAGTVLGALVLLPNAALAATGFFMGFSISTESVLGTSVSLFSGDVSAAHHLWSLAPLVAAAVVGVQRARATSPDAPLLADAIPAGLGSVVVWLGAAFALHVGTGTFGAGVGIGFGVPSLVIGAFAWGVLSIVLGRIVLRPLARVVPRLAVASTGAPPQRMSRRATATVVGLSLAAVAGTAAYQLLAQTAFSPRVVADDYLAALESGDVEAARDRLRVSGRTGLLVPGVLPEGHRVTDARVDRLRQHGDRADVVVTFTVAGDRQTQTLRVEADGHRFGLFRRWVVTNGTGHLSLTTVAGADTVEVNGVTVAARELALAELLPGVYDIRVPGKPYLAFGGGSLRIGLGDTLPSFELGLSPSGEEQAQEAVATWLRDCLARATTLTTTCGVSSYRSFPQVEGVQWTLVTPPPLTSRYDPSTDSVRVMAYGLGEARVTGTSITPDFLGDDPTRAPFTDVGSVTVSGTVTFEGTQATYRPS